MFLLITAFQGVSGRIFKIIKGGFNYGEKKALILTTCGTIITLLVVIFVTFGIAEDIERSQYQNTALDIPVIILLVLLFAAGVAALVIGIKKMKSGKQKTCGYSRSPMDRCYIANWSAITKIF